MADPPKRPSFSFYLRVWCYMVWNTSLIGSGHLPDCVFPTYYASLPTKSISFGDRVRNREVLYAVQTLSIKRYNNNVLPVLFWSKIQIMAPYDLL